MEWICFATDRNVRPGHQTLTSQTVSMHWSNAIAVKDRCDFSALADEAPLPILLSSDANGYLFNSTDLKELLKNVSILVERVLVQHIPSFSKYSNLVVDHISHQFSSEMSTHSQVVNILTLFQSCCNKIC